MRLSSRVSAFVALTLFVVIALLMPMIAIAADMPVKAPRDRLAGLLSYPAYDSSGLYWGIGTEAGVAQSSVGGRSTFVGSAIGGDLTAAGGGVGLTIGFMKGNGTYWIAPELTVSYQNITATEPGNVTVGSRWAIEQVVKFGGFTNLLAYLPNLGITFPTLPQPTTPSGFNVVPNTSHPYIMAGMREWGLTASYAESTGRSWAAAPLIGMGVLNQLNGVDGKLSGAVLDVGAKLVFASRGFAFDPGTGSGAVGTANLGNQYFVYAKVLW